MEERSFGWLLHELSNIKYPVRILEVGICRGTKLLSWYHNDSMGIICKKPVKPNSKTRTILSHFISQTVPFLEEYSPDKIICYLYHLGGIRLVKMKEAAELAENQLHGLAVRSIHQALTTSANYSMIYQIRASYDNGEIFNELTCGAYNKPLDEEVKDSSLCERAINLTVLLSEYFFKYYGKYITEFQAYLVADTVGQLYIMRVNKIVLNSEIVKIDPMTRRIARNLTTKLENALDDSVEEGGNENNLYKNFLDGRKKDQGKAIRKQLPQNSGVFLDMIAKTFDRERKVLDKEEILKEKKKELEIGAPASPSSLASGRLLREEGFRKKQFGNIGELLGYLEASRPKIWIRDKEIDGSPSVQSPGLGSPMSEKIFRESSGVERMKRNSKAEFNHLPNLHRTKHEVNFLTYLSTERVRLKNKITSREKLKKIRAALNKKTD